MPTLEQIRTCLSGDRYAVEVTGVVIQDAGPGTSVCTLKLRPELLNANHKPMGGAIFTLADFAFAVAANGHSRRVTVSQQVSINFLAAARGQMLTARAARMKEGGHTSLYGVEVTDETGAYVAHATVTGYILPEQVLPPMPEKESEKTC